MPLCLLTRPQPEISVCGWLTKVWIEQQPWLTGFFDPAPAELLRFDVESGSAPHSLQQSLIHTRLKLRLTRAQRPILSNLWSLQIHRLLVGCVSRQTHRAETLHPGYSVSQSRSFLSVTFYFKVKRLRNGRFCFIGFKRKIKRPSSLCQTETGRTNDTAFPGLIIKLHPVFRLIAVYQRCLCSTGHKVKEREERAANTFGMHNRAVNWTRHVPPHKHWSFAWYRGLFWKAQRGEIQSFDAKITERWVIVNSALQHRPIRNNRGMRVCEPPCCNLLSQH